MWYDKGVVLRELLVDDGANAIYFENQKSRDEMKGKTPKQIREENREADPEGFDPRNVEDINVPFPPHVNTLARQMGFLAAFQESLTDTEACKKASISRATLYQWLADDVGGFSNLYRKAAALRMRNMETLAFDVVSHFGNDPERYEKLLRYPTLMLKLMSANDPKYKEGVIGQGEDAQRMQDKLFAMSDIPKEKIEAEKTAEEQVDDILQNNQG